MRAGKKRRPAAGSNRMRAPGVNLKGRRRRKPSKKNEYATGVLDDVFGVKVSRRGVARRSRRRS